MATNETTSKLTENQRETLNVEPDQLSEKETDQVVGGKFTDLGMSYSSSDDSEAS